MKKQPSPKIVTALGLERHVKPEEDYSGVIDMDHTPAGAMGHTIPLLELDPTLRISTYRKKQEPKEY